MPQTITDLATNVKAAAVVATGTTSTGIGAWFSWIPPDIANLGGLLGGILSIILIFTHLKKSRIDAKKCYLEMKIMKQREADRRQEVADRRAKHRPTNRADDV